MSLSNSLNFSERRQAAAPSEAKKVRLLVRMDPRLMRPFSRLHLKLSLLFRRHPRRRLPRQRKRQQQHRKRPLHPSRRLRRPKRRLPRSLPPLRKQLPRSLLPPKRRRPKRWRLPRRKRRPRPSSRACPDGEICFWNQTWSMYCQVAT